VHCAMVKSEVVAPNKGNGVFMELSYFIKQGFFMKEILIRKHCPYKLKMRHYLALLGWIEGS